MQIPDDLFQRFAALREACIDASSIIYMQKAGFFDIIRQALRLYSVPAIIEEVGPEACGIHVIQSSDQTLTPDAQLIQCGRERRLSIISEDKQILRSAQYAHLPYYNALMMVNWLFFTERIDRSRYQSYHTTLRTCARYSDAVWNVGAAVHHAIRQFKNPVVR